MGEKIKKRFSYDFHCEGCNYKGRLEELKEKLFVVEMTNGKLSVECPKCELYQLAKNN